LSNDEDESGTLAIKIKIQGTQKNTDSTQYSSPVQQPEQQLHVTTTITTTARKCSQQPQNDSSNKGTNGKEYNMAWLQQKPSHNNQQF
jgi:hypothetical protein